MKSVILLSSNTRNSGFGILDLICSTKAKGDLTYIGHLGTYITETCLLAFLLSNRESYGKLVECALLILFDGNLDNIVTIERKRTHDHLKNRTIVTMTDLSGRRVFFFRMVDAMLDAEADDAVKQALQICTMATLKVDVVASLVAGPPQWNSCHFVLALTI